MLASYLVLFRRSLNIAACAWCHSICSDQDWSRRGEDTSVGLSWWSLWVDELWESQGGFDELFGLLSDDLVIWLDGCLDDVNWVTSGAVSTSHFRVHLTNCTTKSVTSVFFEHVHNTCSGKILKEDSVVLNCIGVSLENLTDRDDFTLALSDLVLSFHLIPELGSGKDDILGENSDSVAGWLCLSVTW